MLFNNITNMMPKTWIESIWVLTSYLLVCFLHNCYLEKMHNILVFLKPPHWSLQDQLLWHCCLLSKLLIESCKLHFHRCLPFFLRNWCTKKLYLNWLCFRVIALNTHHTHHNPAMKEKIKKIVTHTKKPLNEVKAFN